MSNTKSFAEREFEVLSKSWDNTNPDNEPVIIPFKEQILALCEAFGNSGQSGGSAPYTASAICSAIKHLLLQAPICPITGINEEWNDVSSYGDSGTNYQNNRCSALFKNSDGKVWYLDAIVWKGVDEYDQFCGTVEGVKSRQFIKDFPFTPKTFYIDVIRQMLPEDWIEEPFYENKTYNTKIFEETGIKEWNIEKYRYLIKDKSQLERVWKYYKQQK